MSSSVPGFEPLGYLGGGSTGHVWRARRSTTGEIVALQILHEHAEPPEGASADDDARSRARRALVRRAAAAASRLDHPNLVRLSEHGEHAGRAFFAWDWADGESLRQRLRRAGPLPPREAARLLAVL